MRCSSCGVEIPDQQKFCVHCGAPRPTSSQARPGESQPSTHKPIIRAIGEVGCSKIFILLVFVLGILLLIYCMG